MSVLIVQGFNPITTHVKSNAKLFAGRGSTGFLYTHSPLSSLASTSLSSIASLDNTSAGLSLDATCSNQTTASKITNSVEAARAILDIVSVGDPALTIAVSAEELSLLSTRCSENPKFWAHFRKSLFFLEKKITLFDITFFSHHTFSSPGVGTFSSTFPDGHGYYDSQHLKLSRHGRTRSPRRAWQNEPRPHERETLPMRLRWPTLSTARLAPTASPPSHS